MKNLGIWIVLLLPCCRLWAAAVVYVDLNSTNPTAPYDSWATASTNIQAAVDAADYEDTILITNGHYLLDAEIRVDKYIKLQSVNGPDETILDGQGKVRCLNLSDTFCTVSGFTLTNGYSAENGGGILCSVPYSEVTNCVIAGNRAVRSGGGMYEGTAKDCIVKENQARYGGGLGDATAIRCRIYENHALNRGGGAYAGTLRVCSVSKNEADWYGGGAYNSSANNCTIVRNRALNGGGSYYGTLNNCIVWDNEADNGDNIYSVTARYCCCPELSPIDGNFIEDPLLISTSHLSLDSPCRGRGNPIYISGKDIDGNEWGELPSIGCDEPMGTTSGSILVGASASNTVTLQNEDLNFSGEVDGAVSGLIWDFGDGTITSNMLHVAHSWNAAGSYDVVLVVYNDSQPDGISLTQTVHVVTAVDSAIYVSPNGDDANDGLSWESAKATIQAGVDAQNYWGGWVLISNGVYVLDNRVLINKKIVVQSINGPEVTIVDGQAKTRCFNLVDSDCLLEGLTIRNGSSKNSGAGVYCWNLQPTIKNCIIRNNEALGCGGGVYRGTAINCLILNNTAYEAGGGMYEGSLQNCSIRNNVSHGNGGGTSQCTLNNCTILGNRAADEGGGVLGGTVNNSIVWNNEAPDGGDLSSVTVSYTCSPDVVHGVAGNITNAPVLISSSHLSVNSPCKGAGSEAYATGVDIDGDLWLSPPSMGCDEPGGKAEGEVSVEFYVENKRILRGDHLRFDSDIEGAVYSLLWDFGDGRSSLDTMSTIHSWNVSGIYDVVLTAFNDTCPSGVSMTQSMHVVSLAEAAIYVAPKGNDANDGSSWATAKATIQAGVNAQDITGGTVFLSNGTYSVNSEVLVNRHIIIQGLNGPEATIVDAQGLSRCFNLDDVKCKLDGLTIRNGYTLQNGGGVYCSGSAPMITNCVIVGNSAISGGGIYAGTVKDCIVTENSALGNGGGMNDSIAVNCIMSNNFALNYGGGMYGGSAGNCTIFKNTVSRSGGGIYKGKANDCSITENTAINGGGLSDGTANNCTISNNTADFFGGGLYYSTANRCVISANQAASGGGMISGTANSCIIRGNSAETYGGGACYSTLNNCTMVENSAETYGGGLYMGTANNSVVWYNAAGSGDDVYSSSVRYSCSPDVTEGVDGNIPLAPCFLDSAAGNYRLTPNSPCINAGLNTSAITSVDRDGSPRIVNAVVDMGAYEFGYDANADEDNDGLVNGWELEYFGSLAGADAHADPDQDLSDNLAEYIAGTDPADAASHFMITGCGPNASFTVEWKPCVVGRLYRVVWSESLTNFAPVVLQDNIEYPQSSYTDTEYDGETSGFYRVEVRLP